MTRSPPPAGVALIALGVPNVPRLSGKAVFAQALLAQPPFGARFTNVTAGVVVPRPSIDPAGPCGTGNDATGSLTSGLAAAQQGPAVSAAPVSSE